MKIIPAWEEVIAHLVIVEGDEVTLCEFSRHHKQRKIYDKEWWHCLRKVAYHTLSAALHARDSAMGKMQRRGTIEAYLCRYSKKHGTHYHFGHAKKQKSALTFSRSQLGSGGDGYAQRLHRNGSSTG